MNEIKLSFIFEPGSDNDPANRISHEELVQLGDFLNQSDFCMLTDYVGWRLEATETFEAMGWNETIETSPAEESTDDQSSHPEQDNQSKKQELQKQ